MKMIKKLFALALFINLAACGTSNYPFLATVDYVDIERYQGKWFEIARLPNSFQDECYCTTAEYKIIDESTLSVVNKCREDSIDGELDDAAGTAFVVAGSNNAKLKVQFFWPFKGDYWIIELDEKDYQFAVVGTPSRKYLWILSRTPNMSDNLYHDLLNRISKKGFDSTKLIVSDPSCFKELNEL